MIDKRQPALSSWLERASFRDNCMTGEALKDAPELRRFLSLAGKEISKQALEKGLGALIAGQMLL